MMNQHVENDRKNSKDVIFAKENDGENIQEMSVTKEMWLIGTKTGIEVVTGYLLMRTKLELEVK